MNFKYCVWSSLWVLEAVMAVAVYWAVELMMAVMGPLAVAVHCRPVTVAVILSAPTILVLNVNSFPNWRPKIKKSCARLPVCEGNRRTN